MCYPVLIDKKTKKVIRADNYLPLPNIPDVYKKIDNYEVAWPIRMDGQIGVWRGGNGAN